MHQYIATIDSPEFLNLSPLDINPLMSKCDIKVFYVGENRNRTFINESVAAEIGKTLRGAPIVGYYKNNKEDFADHGEKVIIDDEGIHFECQTVPYGFVSPDAEVWFQNFQDTDDFGNKIVHKYLMTTGYLWTDQFPQANLPIVQGRPQSMELKKQSMQGQWKTNYEKNVDFFIINDAIIQKICILGDDVEPCFEGASVTAPDVSAKFTLDNNFKRTLYNMMQDLKNALSGGGQQMDNLENSIVAEEKDQKPSADFTVEKIQENSEVTLEENNIDNTSVSTDYEKKEEDKTSAKEKEDKQDDNNSSNESKEEDSDDDDDKKEKGSKNYELLEKELNSLKESYSVLQNQYQELVNFKNQIDNQKKDALIAEFYMLSEEDKAEVIKNKQKYTLDEIKAKLSVICFDKKINFTLEKNEEKVNEEKVITYNLNDNKNNSLPDWVKAVKEQEKLD